MFVFILIVVILLLLGILGAVIEGLLWLTGAAIVLFLIAAAYGYFKFKSWRSAD